MRRGDFRGCLESGAGYIAVQSVATITSQSQLNPGKMQPWRGKSHGKCPYTNKRNLKGDANKEWKK